MTYILTYIFNNNFTLLQAVKKISKFLFLRNPTGTFWDLVAGEDKSPSSVSIYSVTLFIIIINYFWFCGWIYFYSVWIWSLNTRCVTWRNLQQHLRYSQQYCYLIAEVVKYKEHNQIIPPVVQLTIREVTI